MHLKHQLKWKPDVSMWKLFLILKLNLFYRCPSAINDNNQLLFHVIEYNTSMLDGYVKNNVLLIICFNNSLLCPYYFGLLRNYTTENILSVVITIKNHHWLKSIHRLYTLQCCLIQTNFVNSTWIKNYNLCRMAYILFFFFIHSHFQITSGSGSCTKTYRFNILLQVIIMVSSP